MRLSELQNKNLVNVSNGKNIGNIIDVNIDYQSGNIKSFISALAQINGVFSVCFSYLG